jgi:ferrous-iron efflux pump FieF
MPKFHLPADKEIRSLYMTVGLYAVIVIVKLIAYFSTHVLALLAESFHTLSDLFISGFLLVALLWSRRSADKEHQFGHGRAQNVAALLAATLFLSFTSFKLYEEAIPKLLHPVTGAHENLPVAIGVLVASMLIAAAPLFSLIRQKSLGAAARAQMIELIND